MKIFVLVVIAFVHSTFTADWHCEMFLQFARICERFDFDADNCYQWNTHSCPIVKTTFNDYKCPQHICHRIVRIKLFQRGLVLGLAFIKLYVKSVL